MKKIILLLLTLIFLNCTNFNSGKNDLISLGLKGNVKSLIQKDNSHIFDKNNYKQFEYHFDKIGFSNKKINYSKSTYTLYDYKNSDKIQTSELYGITSNKLIYTVFFEYDKKDKVSNIKYLDSTSTIIRARTYNYISDNNGTTKIIEKEKTADGELIEHFEKTINKDDKEIFRETFDKKGNKVSSSNAKYDDRGNMIYKDKIDSSNNLKWSVQLKYNDNDFEIERVLYNPSIDRKTFFKSEYVLDDKLNWIKKIMIKKNDTIQTRERIIEYY